MNRQSLEDFIKAMGKKPQTSGFDAVLAFDRSKANVLLMQEYIDRFDSNAYFPAFDSEVETSAGVVYHHLQDLKVDKPRLSFENASIAASKAKLFLRCVSGAVREYNKPTGTTRLNLRRLGYADGLLGPTLTVNIDLQGVQGTADKAGKVLLDLSAPSATSYHFSGVDAEFEAVKLGQHLKQEIGKWTPAQKQLVLSELPANPQDVLQPGRFTVRTHPAPGATLERAENFGDGEVLLYIAMQGNELGQPPVSDEQQLYLLPDGYSSNLLLSHQLVVSQLIMAEIKKVTQLANVEFAEELVNGFKKYTAKNGAFSDTPPVWGVPWLGTCEYEPVTFPFATSAGKLRVELADNKLAVRWSGTTSPTSVHAMIVRQFPESPGSWNYRGTFSTTWSFEQLFSAKVSEEGERPSIIIESTEPTITVTTQIQSGSGDSEARSVFEGGVSGVAGSLAGQLSFLSKDLSKIGYDLDAFRLNGLLFRGKNVVQPRAIALPGDLTAPGELAPDRTEMVITTAEQVVAAGASFTFQVTPATQGIEWGVSNLPGESGDTGTINKQTGAYVAPAASAIGHGKRVIVTASKGTAKSKALVQLVADDVSVFPSVMTVGGSGEYLAWAASIDGKALHWAVTGNAGGKVEAARNPDPQVQDSRLYTPAQAPSDPVNDLDYVVRLDRIQVSRTAGGPHRVIEVIRPLVAEGNYFIKADNSATQATAPVQFKLWGKNKKGEEYQIPEGESSYYLLSGEGTLNKQTGLFTPSATRRSGYAIVAAIREDDDAWLWSYVIHPLTDTTPADAQVTTHE